MGDGKGLGGEPPQGATRRGLAHAKLLTEIDDGFVQFRDHLAALEIVMTPGDAGRHVGEVEFNLGAMLRVADDGRPGLAEHLELLRRHLSRFLPDRSNAAIMSDHSTYRPSTTLEIFSGCPSRVVNQRSSDWLSAARNASIVLFHNL